MYMHSTTISREQKQEQEHPLLVLIPTATDTQMQADHQNHILLACRARALGEPARLALFALLCHHGDTLDVVTLVRKMAESGYPLSQPTISHHLHTLSEAGLLGCRRAGNYSYYYPLKEALAGAALCWAFLYEEAIRALA